MDMRAFFLLLICCAVVHAADIPAPLAARMDQTAVSFKSFSADLKQTDHTAIVNDDAELTGIFRMRRVKPGDARVLIDYKGTDARAISFEGDKVQIFYPKINTVQVYQVGNRRGLLDQFLLLGFGATVAELKSSYEVSYLGTETIGGLATSHLRLIPKSADVLKILKVAELWMDDATGLPVQQKFSTSSTGDYKLITYLGAKQNPALSEKDIRLNLPRGAVTQVMPR